MGYRSIDCAEKYSNEKEIGEVLANLVDSDEKAASSGKIKRSELFITSKVWVRLLFNGQSPKHRELRSILQPTNSSKENVRKACENTLKNLGLSYLDLYLVHWYAACSCCSVHSFLAHLGRFRGSTRRSRQCRWRRAP